MLWLVLNPFLCCLSPFHLVLCCCFKAISEFFTQQGLIDIDEGWVEEGDLSSQNLKALHVMY